MLLSVRVVLVLALVAPLSSRKPQTMLTKGSRGRGCTVKLVLDSSVKPGITTSSSSSTANMSVSPWVYREQCVENRVPKCLSHAQCLTTGCKNPQWGTEDLSLEAKPIYYQVLVLYRVPKGRQKPHREKKPRRGYGLRKGYDFKLGTEVVSVGCTCVKPSVLPQK